MQRRKLHRRYGHSTDGYPVTVAPDWARHKLALATTPSEREGARFSRTRLGVVFRLTNGRQIWLERPEDWELKMRKASR